MDSFQIKSPSDEARFNKRKYRHNIISLKIVGQYLDAMNAELFHLNCDELKGMLTHLGDEISSEQARQEIKMDECREIILSQVGQLEQKLNQVIGGQ